MQCDQSHQVHAYHDGQMSAAERAAFETHLAQCAVCRQELEQLRQMSRMLVDAPLPQMRHEFSDQIVAAWQAGRESQDRSVRKLAGWLTAAAAVVLIAAALQFNGSLFKRSEKSNLEIASINDRDWDFAAVMPPAHLDDTGTADLVQVTQWMARDLSPQERP